MKRLFFVPCLLLALCAAAAEPNTHRAQPNILIILADDLGWSDLGCYGGEIQTPNIDSLAKDGLRFTQFYNFARCCPSRAALLTGLYPHQAGVGSMTADEGPNSPGYRGRLNDRCVTIAEVLRTAGYRTFMSGKWHVGDFDPTTRGFDEFYGFYKGYAVDSWNPRMLIRLPEGRPPPKFEKGEFYATDAITDEALQFLTAAQKTKDRPWFLYLAYQAPHFPLQAPAVDIAKYTKLYEKGWDDIRARRLARSKELGLVPPSTVLPPRSLIPLPSAARRHGLETGSDVNPAWDSLSRDRQIDLAHRMAIFAAMVDHMDRQIGRVFSALKANDAWNNTLILFLSDNGACAEWDPFGFDLTLPPPESFAPGTGINMGTPGAPNILHRGEDLARLGGPGTYISYGSGWANACNTPWRLYKHYDFEGGISAPLIAHWPEGIEAKGAIRQQPGIITDLMATCADVAGAHYPTEKNGVDIQPMEGRSLVPAFKDQPIARDYMAWEHEGNRAIRQGPWKLVALHNEPWELHDIRNDRTELHNVASEHPRLVARLSKQWHDWAERCFVRIPGPVTPQIANKPLTITCLVQPEPGATDGVILAQGGNQQGYSLWLHNGKLAFSVRVNRRVTSIESGDIPSGAFRVSARLSRDGSMELAADGRTLAAGKAPGLIPVQPIDELSVGQDSQSAVGEYRSLSPLRGSVQDVRIITE